MRIDRKRMRIVATILLAMEAAFFSVFLLSRPALTAEEWGFLERQRPHYDETGMTMSLVADGLNFALARRAIGGWETAFGHIFILSHLPAFFTASLTFAFLQATSLGSSKLNSDLSTAVFVAVVSVQWLGVASILSLRASSARAG